MVNPQFGCYPKTCEIRSISRMLRDDRLSVLNSQSLLAIAAMMVLYYIAHWGQTGFNRIILARYFVYEWNGSFFSAQACVISPNCCGLGLVG